MYHGVKIAVNAFDLAERNMEIETYRHFRLFPFSRAEYPCI